MSERRTSQQNSMYIESHGEKEAVVSNKQERGYKSSVTIDGVTYTLESLGDQGHEQLQNLRVTDQEIRRLEDQLAIMQTARNTYARILSDMVKNVAPQA